MYIIYLNHVCRICLQCATYRTSLDKNSHDYFHFEFIIKFLLNGSTCIVSITMYLSSVYVTNATITLSIVKTSTQARISLCTTRKIIKRHFNYQERSIDVNFQIYSETKKFL